LAEKPSLDDAYFAVDRGRDKIKEFKKDVRRFEKERSHEVWGEPDPTTGKYVLTVTPQEVPKQFGFTAGEIISVCFRPALDYLVANLAWLDCGDRVKGTQFPICSTPGRFNEKSQTWLKGVNATHVAAIEKLQPYGKKNRLFALLRDLSNPAKHVEIHSVNTDLNGGFEVVERMKRIRRINPTSSPAATSGSPLGDTPAKRNATLKAILKRAHAADPPKADPKPRSRISIPDNHPLAKSNVHVHVGLTCYVAFPDRLPVVPVLELLQAGVREVLDGFHPTFKV